MHARVTSYKNNDRQFDEVCRHEDQFYRTLCGIETDKICLEFEFQNEQDFKILEEWLRMAKKSLGI